MNDRLKNFSLSVLLFSLFLIGVFYVFNFRVSRYSSDIEYSPGQHAEKDWDRDFSVKPKNIVLFIADGLGFSHMSLAMHTQQTENAVSVWEKFEVRGWHNTKSTYGPLTDSGASATAMATGTPAYWDVIGQSKDGERLTNVFEMASDQGYTTGIVTDSYVWDATPASFVAHTGSRDNSEEILTQLASSELDLLFGELEDLGEEGNPDYETTIEILTRRFHLLDKSLSTSEVESIDRPIAAIYDEDEIQDLDSSPNLTRMTEVALNRLHAKDKPFILLVECEEMDAALHRNDSKRIIRGLKSLQSALSLVLEYSKTHGETLVVFTSDHETGGLAAVANFNNYPSMQIRWSTKEHTGTVVPILAIGPGAEHFASIDQTWEIGKILKGLISDN